MFNLNLNRTVVSRWKERSGVRLLGTTLVELLVVIVVFLVGILAIVQVFGRGLQLLSGTKNNTVATELAHQVSQDVTARPDELPDMIEAVVYNQGTPIVDPNKDPNDLGPTGDSLSQQGILSLGGNAIGDWQLHSGANSYRRVVGEGKHISAPSNLFGAGYASVAMLDFGPQDLDAPIYVYGNSLTRLDQLPHHLGPSPVGTTNVTIGGNTVAEPYYTTTDATVPYEYFVQNPNSSSAGLVIPTSPYNRTYHISLSAYVLAGANTTRLDYPDLSVYIPGVVNSGAATPPFVFVPVSDILVNTPGALQAGQSLTSVEFESIDLSPQFVQMTVMTFTDNDPYEFTPGPNGALYFNPAGYSTYIERPGGAREPLMARVNYDVEDWRIIHQDFRIDAKQNISGNYYAQLQLTLGDLKVSNNSGPDNLVAGNPALFTTYAGSANPYDNIALIDDQTGFFLWPTNTNGRQLLTVDKHNGIVTINGINSSGSSLIGDLAAFTPGNANPTLIPIDLTGRSFRVLYMAKNEWSVRVLKPASLYSPTYTLSPPPSPGQYYVPVNALGTRIYFPKADVNAKITIDQIFYNSSTSTTPKTMFSQDFVIQYPTVPDSVGLPCIDITSVDPTATQLALGTYGTVARGVKGASLSVQVLYNPASFRLTGTPATNMSHLNVWGQSWRHSTTQTYLQPEVDQ